MVKLDLFLIAFLGTLTIRLMAVDHELAPKELVTPNFVPPTILTDGFDFPVGAPNAKGYYNAQKFGVNNHLGDDWNGVGGGNTDFGDPIYSVGKGRVTEVSQFYGGWGKVVRVAYSFQENNTEKQVESLYAHMDSVFVKNGDILNRGQKLGTIGNAEGIYLSHLHFEIRNKIALPLGQGYSKDQTGYLDPTKFIKAHRPK
jgi:murein DD-endopeptidase MepM/ murein hydrolase activator NlpD